MEIRIINSIEGFMDLKHDYLQLVHQNKNLTPFYTHRWLAAWWRAFQDSYQVHVFCLYKKNNLELAMPIMFGDGTVGKVKIKKASFLGGNWGLFDLPVSERARGWEEKFLSWLFSNESPDWTLLQLGPLSCSSLKVAPLLEKMQRKGVSYKLLEKTNPYLPINSSWNEFLATKTKNFRRTIKRKEKKARDHGLLEFARLINPSVNVALETMFEISRKTWQGQEGVAVASSKEGKSFYKLLFSGEGEFDTDLNVIYCGDECVAYLFGLLLGPVYHAFDTGFDPAFSDYSPGLLVHFYAMRELFGNDLKEFNFGLEHSYKGRFEPLDHKSFEILVYRHRLIRYFSKLVEVLKACS